MKRIIILAAFALLMLPVSVAKAAPVTSSPIGINADDGDPFEQIMEIVKELKEIKEELQAIQANKENTKKFVDQAALDAAGKALIELLRLQEIQEKYGSMPVTRGDCTRLTDYIVQNYELLQDKALTDEAAQALHKSLAGIDTIGELIDVLVTEL